MLWLEMSKSASGLYCIGFFDGCQPKAHVKILFSLRQFLVEIGSADVVLPEWIHSKLITQSPSLTSQKKIISLKCNHFWVFGYYPPVLNYFFTCFDMWLHARNTKLLTLSFDYIPHSVCRSVEFPIHTLLFISPLMLRTKNHTLEGTIWIWKHWCTVIPCQLFLQYLPHKQLKLHAKDSHKVLE